MKRAIAVIVMCLGVLAISMNIQGDNVVIIQGKGQFQDAFLTLKSDDNETVNQGIAVYSNETISWNGLCYLPLAMNISNIVQVQLGLYAWSVAEGGFNISLHNLTAPFHNGIATWNNRTVDYTWDVPGGDYAGTPIDTLEISDNEVWYYFDITDFYNTTIINYSGKNYYGFVLISDNTEVTWKGVAFGSVGNDAEDYYPKIIITYGYGSSSIIEDVWNLKGFSGNHKLASTIYSEIPNCTAISWKNATSGYWYTYWPSLGLAEDEYLEFGDGLFILASENTTWDHT